MDKPKHSPEPWRREKNSILSGQHPVCELLDSPVICEDPDDYDFAEEQMIEQQRADGSLIKMSPTLLRLLKKFVEKTECMYFEMEDPLFDTLNEARCAIREAEKAEDPNLW